MVATIARLGSGGPPRALGRCDECLLALAESLAHLALDLAPRLAEETVVLRPPLPQPRLEPIGPVAYPVSRDRIQDPPAQRRVRTPRHRDHRLEGQEGRTAP